MRIIYFPATIPIMPAWPFQRWSLMVTAVVSNSLCLFSFFTGRRTHGLLTLTVPPVCRCSPKTFTMSLLHSSPSALRAHGQQGCGRNCSSASSVRAQRVAFSGSNVRRNVVVKASDEVRTYTEAGGWAGSSFRAALSLWGFFRVAQLLTGCKGGSGLYSCCGSSRATV